MSKTSDWAKYGGWWRFWVSIYNPWPDQMCFDLHTCNSTLMFAIPGATLSFYFGSYPDAETNREES